MGYQVARKHAEKLRRIVLATLAAPIALLALATISPLIVGMMLTKIAVASAIVGVAVERWLFFAEAEHIVNIYYGTAAV